MNDVASHAQRRLRATPSDVASSPHLAPAMALQITNVSKRFGDRTALDGVSLTIAAGEAVGLLGPNGAGKSTLIAIVAGVSTADSGTVSVFGVPMGVRVIDAKRNIGYVPQEIALYPAMSAAENLIFFGRMNGLRSSELRARVHELLELIGLAERSTEAVEKLSGGMQRRINIGAALIHQPKLLILDEPTVGVDPQSRNNILEFVERLLGTGMSVLYTSHYFEEIERICERVAIMDHGRILIDGDKRTISASSGVGERIRISVTPGLADRFVQSLERLPGIDRADVVDDTVVEIRVSAAHEVLGAIYRSLPPKALAGIKGVEVIQSDLEAAFLALTGRQSRD